MQTTEVSLGGVGFVLHREAVVALAQGGAILTVGDCLEVSFGAVTVGDLRLRGRVRAVRRLSQEQYQVGVGFEDVGARQQVALGVLVEQARSGHLRP